MVTPPPPGASSRAFVVIPCLNERDRIGDLIDELLRDPGWVDPLIVVADGGSTDGSLEIIARRAARDVRVCVLHNPMRIQSAAVNAAARRFGPQRGRMIRVDAHAHYSPNYVSTLLREAGGSGAASVVVAMRSVGETCFQRAVAAAQNTRLGTGGSAHRREGAAGPVDHGHHALFEVEPFLAVGGYDESFTHNEDAELDVRLAQAGETVWLTRDVSMDYHPRSGMRALIRQYLGYGRGRAMTTFKHALPLKIRQLAPLAVPPAVLLLAAAPWQAAAALPAGLWAATCLAYGAWLGARARSPCAVAAGPAAMLMHLAFGIGFWGQLPRHLAGRGRARKSGRLGVVPR